MSIEGVYEVSIDGRPYRAIGDMHRRGFLDVVRQQADSSNEPGERSLNPHGIWRRSQSDWRDGAGQARLDHADSVRSRFEDSAELWVFDTDGVTNRNDLTSHTFDIVGTEFISVRADRNIWAFSPTNGGYIDIDTWVADTSELADPGGATTIRDVATDGTNLYAAASDSLTTPTAGGVYVAEPGDTAWTKINDLICDRIWYVAGRLMVAAAADIYNITDITDPTPPAPLTPSSINSTWTWDAFGYGQSFIYASGHSDQVSYIYRITLREDGTALTAPTVAAQLPDGEYATVLQTFMRFILIGTNRGLRLGVLSGGGFEYGPLIEVGSIVDVEFIDRFVYFCTTTDVYVADLSRFTTVGLVPAYSHWHDAGAQIDGLYEKDGKLLVHVSASAVLEEIGTPTAVDGTLNTGTMNFGLTSNKQLLAVEVDASLTVGQTLDVVVVVDGVSTALGTIDDTDSMPYSFPLTGVGDEQSGRRFSLDFTLAGGALLHSWTVKASPITERTESIVVGLDLRRSIAKLNGAVTGQDVWTEFEALQDLVKSNAIVSYGEFGKTYRAQVNNVQWGPQLDVASDNTSWEGVCQVELRIHHE